MRSLPLALALLLLCGPVHAASPRLALTIAIDESSASSDFHRSTGQFFVMATVKNISTHDESVVFWTQAGWSFLSNNPAITPGIEALKNSPVTITLKPGESRTQGAEMFGRGSKDHPLVFRLGYYPNAQAPISSALVKPAADDIVWSNEVVLAQ